MTYVKNTKQESITLPDIEARSVKYLVGKRRVFPCNTNRCSALDDPCLRRLVYWRTNWKDAKPVDLGLQGIFEIGTDLEPILRRFLEKLGEIEEPKFRLVSNNAPVTDTLLGKYNITGELDCIMQVMVDNLWKNAAVTDIKTCSQHVYNSINSFADLQKFPWTKKYIGQLYLYSLAFELEQCVLVFFSKQNPFYRPKMIGFPLDYSYVEILLQKAAMINKHIAENTLPDKLEQPKECCQCLFDHICMPDIIGTGNLTLSDNPELEELLIERRQTAEHHQRYQAIDKRLKEILVPNQDLIVGDFILQWKEVHKNFMAQAARSATEYHKKITYTGKEEDNQTGEA